MGNKKPDIPLNRVHSRRWGPPFQKAILRAPSGEETGVGAESGKNLVVRPRGLPLARKARKEVGFKGGTSL